MPALGLRLSLRAAGIFQLLSVTSSVCLASALQLTSEGKTFWRVEQELRWSEALDYCRQHHTDLADLQSMNSWSSIKALYSLTSSTGAWIGLFFDVQTRGPRWSSGSIFSIPVWTSMPSLEEGLCVTLYSITLLVSLGAASCTAQKPFICYYDPAVGLGTVLQPAVSLTTSGKPVEVQIGRLTFKRFDQDRTWLAALQYCRRYYTDLADLQSVTDKADKEALKSIASKTEAWIGLYFNAASGSLRWSSDAGTSIPAWLKVPQFGPGLCAGLASYWSFFPRVSSVDCSSLKPFICFNDPTVGHRVSAALPELFYTPSSAGTAGTTPRPRTSPGSAGTKATEGRLAQRLSPEPPELCSATPGPRASVFAGSAAPQPQGTAAPSPPAHAMLEYSPAPDRGPWTPPVATQSASIRPAPPASLLTPAGSAPPGRPPVLQEVIGSPLTFISSPAPSPAPPEDPVTQGGPGTPLEASLSSTLWASAHRGVATPPGSATSSQSRSAEPPGSEENTLEPSGSGSSAGPQRAVTHSEWAAPSQAAHLETPGSRLGPETAVTSEKSGTYTRDTATATQAQHLSSSHQPDSKEETPAPKPAQLFGILKADFIIPVLMDPEDMKDQFLNEIQEALKLTLGQEKFRLKWVGFEENKK
uniref:C-type lectin domain-containing protein n=1 Tax=Sus scrofa TaxID=9823 RepID=A0A8D1EPP6_PIG